LSFQGPRRDQVLVGTCHPAQFRYGLPLGPVLLALTLGGAEREPGGFCQQVGAAVGDFPELRRSGGFLVVGQGAPAGVPLGDARQASGQQSVTVGLGTIISHLARIEYGCNKSKLAKASFRSLARRVRGHFSTLPSRIDRAYVSLHSAARLMGPS